MAIPESKINPVLNTQSETALKRLSALSKFLRGEISAKQLRNVVERALPKSLYKDLGVDGMRPKISQQVLGEMLGCSYAGVQGWEANRSKGGNSFPRLHHYVRLAEYANLTLNEITLLLFDYPEEIETPEILDTTCAKIDKIIELIRQIEIPTQQDVAKLLDAIVESCASKNTPAAETNPNLFFSPQPPEKKYIDLDFQILQRVGLVFLESQKLNPPEIESLIDNGIQQTVFDTLMLAVNSDNPSALPSVQIEETQLNILAAQCCKIRGWIEEDGELAVWLNPQKKYVDFEELRADLNKHEAKVKV